MNQLRSMFFYVVLFLSTLYFGIASVICYYITRGHDWAHRCGRGWGKVNLWAAGVDVRIRGTENIEPDRSYIFAANHQGLFDIFALFAKLPVQFRWLAKEELFRIPVLGQAMYANGAIPIDRGDRRKAFQSIDQAAAKVRNGASILIFPEGTRSLDGVLQDFKTGGFILAIKSRQQIVPISISGSYLVLSKKGSWTIEPGPINMHVAKPIPTAGLTTRNRDMLMAAVREAIRENLPEREGGIIRDDNPFAASSGSPA